MTCALCGRSVAAFETYGIPPRAGRCPHCGSKGRHRALAVLARQRLLPRLGPGREILEVGPTRSILSELVALWGSNGARYTAADLRPFKAAPPAPHRFLVMDVRALSFPDASFDLVLCGNTLSFVREDRAALAELRRVLKPGGLALLTVHREPGPTVSAEEWRRRRPELVTPEYLEENGTAWYYGEDYEERLSAAGFAAAEHGKLTLAAPSPASLTDWLGGSR